MFKPRVVSQDCSLKTREVSFSGDATGIFTARKRSLGQGNIFTPVCHSVHGGGWRGWYPSMHCRWYPSMPCSRGVLSQHALQVVSQHALQWGVPALGGLLRGVAGGNPPDGYSCGRYASYWNAFVFNGLFLNFIAI